MHVACLVQLDLVAAREVLQHYILLWSPTQKEQIQVFTPRNNTNIRLFDVRGSIFTITGMDVRSYGSFLCQAEPKQKHKDPFRTKIHDLDAAERPEKHKIWISLFNDP